VEWHSSAEVSASRHRVSLQLGDVIVVHAAVHGSGGGGPAATTAATGATTFSSVVNVV